MTTTNMTNSKEVDAALALWRFGLGARQGDLAAIKDDARDLLREEINERAVPVPVGAKLQSTPALLSALYVYQDEVKAERERERSQAAAVTASATTADMKAMAPAGGDGGNAMQGPPMMAKPQDMPVSKRPYFPQQILLAEAEARFSGTIHQPLIGFGERLAMFWANHFSVAISKGGEVHILAGAFEREAIRPHLFGRFDEMLMAVETHPAMLVFLDNQQSVGPNSPAGQKGKRGLNENLAREIMELHTLGVNGGYSQADVTSLSRIITGWTFTRSAKAATPGVFGFNPGMHEPGDHAVMGVTYAEGGFEQGRRVLADLARHPATARHLCLKLARHFVADQPPEALVASMAAAYTKSDGNLSEVYRAMIDNDLSWQADQSKLRQPMDYVVAMIRAAGLRPKPEQVVSMLKALGQPLWDPSGPNGFSDVSDGWASSEGLATRMDAASLFAHQVGGGIDPREFAADRLGPLASQETLTAVARAETKPQGLSIAFLSPEFQRR
ncbi:DUF1800 domain-containing protein [Rhizobium paknamense]|uniref:Uncharacterized protein (DUF1800 family) n=1 Tax=Rhizobium paknamense TaxID=1206817 RepID=A0ABU0IDU3_9HYPH|nr:DUF1800 family protein [Rhizobium paknamense]MDQ0456402.1 uncharacterized protein (DUF1800 family) [Rhizobium paknamense]